MAARPGLTKERIIERALELAEEEDLSNVTMANLARSFSIKPPSLYNHFKNLHEIKQAMALEAQEMLYNDLKEAVDGEGESGDRIQEMAKRYVKFASRFSGIYEASLLAPDLKERSLQQGEEPLVELLQKYVAPYNLSEQETIHAIRGLRSLLHGLVDLNKREGFKRSVDLEETRSYLVQTFVNGLHHNGKT